jgi:hypothetical protein
MNCEATGRTEKDMKDTEIPKGRFSVNPVADFKKKEPK